MDAAVAEPGPDLPLVGFRSRGYVSCQSAWALARISVRVERRLQGSRQPCQPLAAASLPIDQLCRSVHHRQYRCSCAACSCSSGSPAFEYLAVIERLL